MVVGRHLRLMKAEGRFSCNSDFISYCERQFSISKSRIYRIMNAAETAENINMVAEACGSYVLDCLPLNEWVARPLSTKQFREDPILQFALWIFTLGDVDSHPTADDVSTSVNLYSNNFRVKSIINVACEAIADDIVGCSLAGLKAA